LCATELALGRLLGFFWIVFKFGLNLVPDFVAGSFLCGFEEETRLRSDVLQVLDEGGVVGVVAQSRERVFFVSV
jgi:hypothetical protein